MQPSLPWYEEFFDESYLGAYRPRLALVDAEKEVDFLVSQPQAHTIKLGRGFRRGRAAAKSRGGAPYAKWRRAFRWLGGAVKEGTALPEVLAAGRRQIKAHSS